MIRKSMPLGPRPDGWVPVFPRDKREAFARRSCSNKKMERDDDSKKSHPALARQLFQFRERRIDRAGTAVAGILDHVVEPTIDIEDRAFAHLAITAVGFARSKAQTADITQPPADGTLH